MEKRTKILQIVKVALIIIVAITWIMLAITVIIKVTEDKNQNKIREQTIIEEREYLTNEYKELKKSISNDIVTIASTLEGNTTLVFNNSDKNKLLKSYSNIINVIKQKKQIEKVTVVDEHNLDIYTAIIIMNEDIKGFSTNFAVAIDDKNFNALDNSLKYLTKMVETMNNIDQEIKAEGLLKK